MASFAPISQSQSLFNKPRAGFILPSRSAAVSHIQSSGFVSRTASVQFRVPGYMVFDKMPQRAVVVAATTAEKQKKRYPGEAKGFVEEMRFVAMKLHTREQAKEGEKEVKKPEEQAIPKWEPSVDGYLRFLVDSKLVYDTLEAIVDSAPHSIYAEFKNTGLERSASLAKDLEWFKEQGYTIPEPSSPGVTYSEYLKELADNDPQAFICHFYNIYFAHSAGGRMIGRKVAEKILDNKELEFYKWEGDLSQILQNVRDKLNKVAENWSREEKNHCLEETERSFKHSGEILRLVLSSEERAMKQIQIIHLALLIYFLSITIPNVRSATLPPQPQHIHGFKPMSADIQAQAAARSCPYTVIIETSCASTSFTRDQISLAFGDSHGNEVYAKRLDDPKSGTFERCSKDTFKITGPCVEEVCYLYMLRKGSDGWKPGSVKVYGPYIRTVDLDFDVFLPNGVWFGFNLCNSAVVEESLSVDM
ncbi:unnamed protein product [Linum tenue]|uniref:heme oxygenase (biliverdin-producing) n=1 Tax=Linum tenue TaxID=586396 RepID=A0AAV0QEU6_9ROSI|nr:unnamed protein product [Linum tenue]